MAKHYKYGLILNLIFLSLFIIAIVVLYLRFDSDQPFRIFSHLYNFQVSRYFGVILYRSQYSGEGLFTGNIGLDNSLHPFCDRPVEKRLDHS